MNTLSYTRSVKVHAGENSLGRGSDNHEDIDITATDDSVISPPNSVNDSLQQAPSGLSSSSIGPLPDDMEGQDAVQ